MPRRTKPSYAKKNQQVNFRADDTTWAYLNDLVVKTEVAQSDLLRRLIHEAHSERCGSALSFAPLIFVEGGAPPVAAPVVAAVPVEPEEDPVDVLRIRCGAARIRRDWSAVELWLDDTFCGDAVDAVFARRVVGVLQEKGMPSIPGWLKEFAES